MCEIFRICLDYLSKAWKFPVMRSHDVQQIALKKNVVHKISDKNALSTHINFCRKEYFSPFYNFNFYSHGRRHGQSFWFHFPNESCGDCDSFGFWRCVKSLNHFCCTQSTIMIALPTVSYRCQELTNLSEYVIQWDGAIFSSKSHAMTVLTSLCRNHKIIGSATHQTFSCNSWHSHLIAKKKSKEDDDVDHGWNQKITFSLKNSSALC